MNVLYGILILTFAGSSLAFAGQFIPKSYYVIDHNGHKSDVIQLRNRRDLMLPLLRLRRSSSSSSSQASSGSGSGSGVDGGGIYFGNEFNPIDPGFCPQCNLQKLASAFGAPSGPSGLGKGGASSFASSYSSSSSGGGGHGGVPLAGRSGGQDGPNLFSRFGEGYGDGVKVSGSAQGERGAFSSSSTSVDGNGKVKYSVQSGKY